MAHTVKELSTDSRGNYVRNLGSKLTGKAVASSIAFTWAEMRTRPARRNARLQDLWTIIEAEAESPKTALWNDTPLQIGMAIAAGETVCHLASPLALVGDEDFRAYVYLIEQYAKKYRMIAVLPADTEAYQPGRGIIEERKQEIVRDVFGEANILEAETRSLHEAIDDYIAHIKATFVDVETRTTTGWGNTQVKEALRLKEKHPNIPLSRLDLTTIEARIPPEVERLPVKVRETDREIQRRARPNQVETYSVAELATLYRYALPFERLYLLLGLNCGFSIAEFGTLRLSQIYLHQPHGHDELVGYSSNPDQSWIKRVRIKTKVYGE